MEEKLKISVIIPTYKRPEYLLHAIISLQKQSLSDFEILVVDNAVEKNVETMIKDFNKKAKIPVCYIPEKVLGFHNALHAGSHKAKSDLVFFTNDDVTIDASCLESYIKVFHQYPKMAAAGGPIKLHWENPPPPWLLDLMDNSKVFPPLSYMEPYDRFVLSPKGFFFETNMAIRKNILFALGGFNPDLYGAIRLGDGDTGLNRKIWQRQLLVGFVPKAIVYHHIPKERMSMQYLIDRYTHEGSSDMYSLLQKNYFRPPFFRVITFFLSFFFLTAKYWLGWLFFKGNLNVFPIKVRLQIARTSSQIRYVKKFLTDKSFRRFVLKRNWLT